MDVKKRVFMIIASFFCFIFVSNLYSVIGKPNDCKEEKKKTVSNQHTTDRFHTITKDNYKSFVGYLPYKEQLKSYIIQAVLKQYNDGGNNEFDLLQYFPYSKQEMCDLEKYGRSSLFFQYFSLSFLQFIEKPYEKLFVIKSKPYINSNSPLYSPNFKLYKTNENKYIIINGHDESNMCKNLKYLCLIIKENPFVIKKTNIECYFDFIVFILFSPELDIHPSIILDRDDINKNVQYCFSNFKVSGPLKVVDCLKNDKDFGRLKKTIINISNKIIIPFKYQIQQDSFLVECCVYSKRMNDFYEFRAYIEKDGNMKSIEINRMHLMKQAVIKANLTKLFSDFPYFLEELK